MSAIYNALSLSNGLKNISSDCKTGAFMNFLGVEKPNAFKIGGSEQVYLERKSNKRCDMEDLLKSPRKNNSAETLAREHSILVHTISTLPRPILSIIGGPITHSTLSLACYGPLRVVTEDARLVFTEESIGLFSGLLFMLSKLPDGPSLSKLLFMILPTLGPRELLSLGIATHFVKSEDMEQLAQEVSQAEPPDTPTLLKIVDRFSNQINEENFHEHKVASNILKNEMLLDQDIYNALIRTFHPDTPEELYTNIKETLSRCDNVLRPIFEKALDSFDCNKLLMNILRINVLNRSLEWDIMKCLHAENVFDQKFLNRLAEDKNLLNTNDIKKIHETLVNFVNEDQLKAHEKPEFLSNKTYLKALHHQLTEIPTTGDIEDVVSGNTSNSDGLSMMENEVYEWFKYNWGHYSEDPDHISKENCEINSKTGAKIFHTNHFYPASECRFKLIEDKIRRTIGLYCQRIGDENEFLKWKNKL